VFCARKLNDGGCLVSELVKFNIVTDTVFKVILELCKKCNDCFRVSAKDASFELRLHLIYLVNDILHHWFVCSLFFLFSFMCAITLFQSQ